MTKSKQLAGLIAKIKNYPQGPSIVEKEIREALTKAFNEGVEQTIIANNKKTFIKPTYNDEY